PRDQPSVIFRPETSFDVRGDCAIHCSPTSASASTTASRRGERKGQIGRFCDQPRFVLFCLSAITDPSVALGALRDCLLTLTTLHSIVVSTASARAMARLCKDEVVV